MNMPEIGSQQEQYFIVNSKICVLITFVNINQKHKEWNNTIQLLCISKTPKQTHNKTQQKYSAWIFVNFYVLGTAVQLLLF